MPVSYPRKLAHFDPQSRGMNRAFIFWLHVLGFACETDQSALVDSEFYTSYPLFHFEKFFIQI
jgi:hypothetical protein